MGISGLLPVLKSIAHRVHISKYSGQKVAIDAYSWLHKGAYSCSQELCENIYTDRYVQYCMQRIALLQENGVIPVVVFDGGRLPMKQEEESGRHRSRRENLEKARAFMASGSSQAAFECYQRAVDISPAVAKRFIDALKTEGVEYVVAPYEADAQMTYLAITGRVHAVITEDSDMLPYGCPRVLFKMDRGGEGEEICAADLAINRGLSFVGFTPQMFLEMCILAGCDFLKAPQKIGMKKAHLNIRKYRSFTKACKGMRFASITVPRGYEAAFQRAIWTFLHQRVFDTETRRLVHLTPIPDGGLVPAPGVVGALPEDDPELSFLGPPLDDALAARIAAGEVDPMTREPFPLEEDAPPQPPSGQLARFKPDVRRTSSMTSGVKSASGSARHSTGSKAPPQKGMLAFFPKLGGQKADKQPHQGPKSAPAAHTGQAWRHAFGGNRALNSQGAQGPPPSLPNRYRPAVAGAQQGSQASLSTSSQEQSQGPQAGNPTPPTARPNPLEGPMPSHGLEAEASSPDAEGAEQPHLSGESSDLLGGVSLAGASFGGCGLSQGGRKPDSDSVEREPSFGGGMEDFPSGGGKRRRTGRGGLDWQTERLDGMSHSRESITVSLDASVRLLPEERDGLSLGDSSDVSVTEGHRQRVPRLEHQQGSASEGWGLPEGSSLGGREDLGCAGFGGVYDSGEELLGRSCENPLGLRGSPTVDEELGGLTRARHRRGGRHSPGASDDREDRLSLEGTSGGEAMAGLGQRLGDAGMPGAWDGSSLLENSRSTVSFGEDMRAPLSPLQQPLRRHPGQEQGNGHRKRKVSHFFGQQHGGPGSDSEDFLSMDEDGCGGERGGSAPIAAQRPAAARPAKENEVQEGGFHDLGHIARYTALACSAVQTVASKCGVQTAALPPQLEASGKVRHPFKAPRPASAVPEEAGKKAAAKKTFGGAMARFKFKKK